MWQLHFEENARVCVNVAGAIQSTGITSAISMMRIRSTVEFLTLRRSAGRSTGRGQQVKDFASQAYDDCLASYREN